MPLDLRRLRFEEFPEWVNFRARHGDRARLKAVADAQGVTVSELLRTSLEIILAAWSEEEPAPPVPRLSPDIRREVTRVRPAPPVRNRRLRR